MRISLRHFYISFVLTAALAVVPLVLTAQTDPGKAAGALKLGKVEGDVQYSKLTPALWHFIGRIKITSENYDLAAEDVQVFLRPGKGAGPGLSSLNKATADGGPGSPVDVHIRRPLQSEAFEILADHAVYTPDSARPGGGKMLFTGHVVVNTRSGFLNGPSVATMDTATVLLGAGDQYPQLETGPAHIVATPAQ